jgi:hypothetical protein
MNGTVPDTCPNDNQTDPVYNPMNYISESCLLNYPERINFTIGQIASMENNWRYYRQASVQVLEPYLTKSSSWRLYALSIARQRNFSSSAKYGYRYWHVKEIELFSSEDCSTDMVDTNQTGAKFSGPRFNFRDRGTEDELVLDYTRGHEPYRAFDFNNSTYWVGMDNFWLGMEFSENVTVRSALQS